MSAFAKLKLEMGANWTTILVGWKSLGVFSPWPDRWTEFPPLISSEDISLFAEERLASSLDPVEQESIAELLSCDLRFELNQRQLVTKRQPGMTES
jgi:hypothetical protein